MHSNTTQIDTSDRRHQAYVIALAEAIGAAMREEAEHAAIVAVPGLGAERSPWLLTYRREGEPVRGWQLSRRHGGRWADVLAFGGSLDAAAQFMLTYDRQRPPEPEPLPLWPTGTLAVAA